MTDILQSNAALLEDISNFVKSHEADLIRDIGRLVSIPSVEGLAEQDAPFGRESKRALDCALQIAEELGLQAVNCENRIGYAVIGEDNGQGYLATITHTDVVPAGDGWEADPFTLRIQDGFLIGRGVLDDKGPTVLCLYALKYLKENCSKLRYPVRALLGCNEETGMQDLKHYLAHYPLPLFCFSPDADFPLINGEKGIYHALLTSTHIPVKVLELEGGVAANAVPAKASALVRADSLESSNSVHAEETEPGLWKLSAAGISGHASMPQGTVNAIGLIVDYLLCQNIPDETELPYFRFLQKLHKATDGSGLGIQSADGRFSPLTAVGGKIITDNGRFSQTIDCRYGTATSGEAITARLREEAGESAEVSVLGDAVPFYMDPENPAIQACIESYRTVTGEKEAKPFTIGGGTYARHFPNATAFGPEHPERKYPAFCGPIHGVNEAASIADFLEALQIYILTLLRLEELDY